MTGQDPVFATNSALGDFGGLVCSNSDNLGETNEDEDSDIRDNDLPYGSSFGGVNSKVT